MHVSLFDKTIPGFLEYYSNLEKNTYGMTKIIHMQDTWMSMMHMYISLHMHINISYSVVQGSVHKLIYMCTMNTVKIN